MIGIGATLFKRMAGGSRFSPSSLFSSGEQGVWYDPSDLTTMFQDDTSAAPAVIGQPVGLMLDKSQGLKLGSEIITNGDFATDSDWGLGNDWSIAGGVASATSSTNDNLRQNRTLVDNKAYLITFTIVSISSGSVLARLGGNTQVSSAEFSEVGTHTAILKANSTSTSFILRSRDSFTGSIDNVSVKEVLGNHATAVDTKRPVLARHPEGGIRNLLSYTQEFDDDYWTKSGSSVTADQEVAPDGTTTAELYQQASNLTAHYLRKSGLAPPATVTGSVYVKRGNCDFVFFSIGGSTCIKSYVNLSTGAVVDSGDEGSGTLTNATVTDVGNGWYRLTISGTFNPAQRPGNNIGLSLRTSGGMPFSLDTAFTGNNENAYVWGMQVEESSTVTEYQHVTDDLRYDITEPLGANSLNYLKFDGTSDGMSLTGLTSTSTPITAWFGYSATNANSGTFRYLLDIETGRTIFAASTNVAGNIGYFDGDYRGFAADANAIKVLTYDLVEDNAKIRVDGTQEYSDATYDQQAIGGDVVLFGKFNLETGRFVAGNLYSCILRAAESTDKEIAFTESYVAKKTGLLAQVDGLATLSLDFGGNTYTARNSNGGIL